MRGSKKANFLQQIESLQQRMVVLKNRKPPPESPWLTELEECQSDIRLEMQRMSINNMKQDIATFQQRPHKATLESLGEGVGRSRLKKNEEEMRARLSLLEERLEVEQREKERSLLQLVACAEQDVFSFEDSLAELRFASQKYFQEIQTVIYSFAEHMSHLIQTEKRARADEEAGMVRLASRCIDRIRKRD